MTLQPLYFSVPEVFFQKLLKDLVPPLVISIMGKFEQILQSWERFKGHKNSE